MKHKDLDKFSEFPIPTYEEWREVAERSLKGGSFDKRLVTHLYEGIAIEPMYQEKDVDHLPTLKEQPGAFPFTRGTTQKRAKWKVSQELSGATPVILNEQAHHDLKRGQDVLHIVANEKAKGNNVNENDRGVSIEGVTDFKTIFEGIDTEKYPIHLYTGVWLKPLLAMVISAVEEKKISGIIAADPLFELAKTGELPSTLATIYDDIAEATLWVGNHQSGLRTILVQSAAYHDGGASATDELACVLSTGVEYVSELMDRGLSADDAGNSIAFSFSIGSQSFVEIAKVRSARLLWAAIMKEFGASEAGQKMVIHARTSAFTKAKLDPYVNMLRSTSEAFSAAIAGADSIQVSPFDEPIQPSTAFSRRIARNTSLILLEESHLAATQDPAGGAWYVEHLTNEITQKTWSQFQVLEANGGMSQALTAGIPQSWINETWNARIKDVETRKQTIVGVNQYANLDEKLLHENKQTDEWRVEETKSELKAVETLPTSFNEWIQVSSEGFSLTSMYRVLSKLNNLEPTMIKEPLSRRRISMPYEQMRDLSKQFERETGKRAEVTLIGLGPLAKFKPRADFAAGYFRAGGFEVGSPISVDALERDQVQMECSNVIVICGTDEDVHQEGASLIKELKKANSEEVRIYVAGKQKGEVADQLNESGVFDYIHMKSNHYEQLMNLWNWRAGK
ncbi:methylmalonyl-CoA mutase family protein [Alkalihalophilus lindianensis]|uniref:Methylmalonyl-CoA mutase family protein n=1 Tax=Alkalihalophilus lindianensis TaxID=1630542 RepID=A0ABU3XAP6_9BACI|nr:methylmalonyl-CoA mutase family protein [Alkalihalophilus lindianensis]MDV2684961.1 methylmalonyl-CoA mutase family protein [Alkalihalophilus lindianensis]